MITKNEERCIERCLLSIKPFVQSMIVLDTGSADKTVEIASSCGAEIHTTNWQDDFAAARNMALDLSDADYNLVLDADEWVTEGGISLQETPLSPQHLGLVLIKSEFNVSDEKRIGNSWIPRLLPRGVRYKGRIHEQPASLLPGKRLPITIAHDGYTPEVRAKKIGRNKEIILEELRSKPENPYLLYSLGKEYEVDGNKTAAYEAYLKAMSFLEENAQYSFDLTYRLVDMISSLGNTEEAILLGDNMVTKWGHIPDTFFILGYVFLKAATQDPDRAINLWLPLAEKSWLRCLELGERPDIDGTIAGRGSFLAANNLVVLYEQQGLRHKADQYRHMTKSDSGLY